MSTGLPRDLLKWLLSLGLTLPVKNVKRDFANGFLLGEVLSKYYPQDVQMHMFENVASIERKRANWHVLTKFFKRSQWPIDQALVESVLNAEHEAAVRLLQLVHDLLVDGEASTSGQDETAFAAQPESLPLGYAYAYPGGPAESHYQHMGQPGPAPPYALPDSSWQPNMQHPWSIPAMPAAGLDQYHQQGEPRQDAAQYAYAQQQQQMQYAQQQHMQEQQQQQQAMMMMMQQQQQQDGLLHHMQQQQAAYAAAMGNGQVLLGPAGGASQVMQFMDYQPQMQPAPTIEFDKRPRPVEFKPYTAKDYVLRNYDPKKQAGYWTLGTLGAAREDEELAEKRRKAEKLKEMARAVREQNLVKSTEGGSRKGSAPAEPAATGSPKDRSTREKALEFAKSITKPELRRTRSVQEGRPGGANDAGVPPQQAQHMLSELERLELQHELDQQRVEAIQQEFMRRR